MEKHPKPAQTHQNTKVMKGHRYDITEQKHTSKSPQMKNHNQNHCHKHHSDNDSHETLSTTEDSVFSNPNNDNWHFNSHYHKQSHRSISTSSTSITSSSSSSSSFLSSSSFSSSTTSSSSSSFSSDTDIESSNPRSKPQHSHSCTDISGKNRYFDESDDTEPLLESGLHPNRKPKQEQSRSPRSGPSHGARKTSKRDGSVRKAKSMESLARPKEKGTQDEAEQEKRKNEAKKNLVKEKMKFSAFLNEITRQVLSPMRLTTLGVTNAQRLSSPGQANTTFKKTENNTEKQELQKNMQGGSDSASSGKHSHSSRCSKRSNCHQRHYSHRSAGSPDHKPRRSFKRHHSWSYRQHSHSPSDKHDNRYHCHHHRRASPSYERNYHHKYGHHHSPTCKHTDYHKTNSHRNHHNHNSGEHHHSTSHHHKDCNVPMHHNHLPSGLHQGHHGGYQPSHYCDHRDCHQSYQSHSAECHTTPHHQKDHKDSGDYRKENTNKHHHRDHLSPDYPCSHPDRQHTKHRSDHCDSEPYHHEDHHSQHHHHSNNQSEHHNHGHHYNVSHSPDQSKQHPNPCEHHHPWGQHNEPYYYGNHHRECHPHHGKYHSEHHHRLGDNDSEANHNHHRDHHNFPHHHQGDNQNEPRHHQGDHHNESHHHHGDNYNKPHYHHGDHHSEPHHHHGDHHSEAHHNNELHHHYGDRHSEAHHNNEPHHYYGDRHSEAHHNNKPHHHYGDRHSEAHHNNEPHHHYGDRHSEAHHHHVYHAGHQQQTEGHYPSHLGLRAPQIHSKTNHTSPDHWQSLDKTLKNSNRIICQDEEQTSFSDPLSKDDADDVGTIMILQEQNEGLQQSLLKTAVRVECLGEEFMSSRVCLEAELQRTRMELSNLTERFRGLHDNCSSTQQTNSLLEHKLHLVAQSMEGERERLNKRISGLTERLADAKFVNSMDTSNVTSMHRNEHHLHSDQHINHVIHPIAPPPAQFMDSLNYAKDKVAGLEQSLGSVPEEEESDWSEIGEETPRFMLTGLNQRQVWRHREGDTDKGSESGSEEVFRPHSPRPPTIPQLQFTVHNELSPFTQTNLSNIVTCEGSYKITTNPRLGSAVLLRSASLEEIPLARHSMHKELRVTEAMMDLHHSGAEAIHDLDNEIIHHLRTNRDPVSVRQIDSVSEMDSAMSNLQ